MFVVRRAAIAAKPERGQIVEGFVWQCEDYPYRRESLLMVSHSGYLQVESLNRNLGVVCGMDWGQEET